MSNAASFVLRILRSVKDHHDLPKYSPRLKNICVRQVVLDKWLPLSTVLRENCVNDLLVGVVVLLLLGLPEPPSGHPFVFPDPLVTTTIDETASTPHRTLGSCPRPQRRGNPHRDTATL